MKGIGERERAGRKRSEGVDERKMKFFYFVPFIYNI